MSSYILQNTNWDIYISLNCWKDFPASAVTFGSANTPLHFSSASSLSFDKDVNPNGLAVATGTAVYAPCEVNPDNPANYTRFFLDTEDTFLMWGNYASGHTTTIHRFDIVVTT